MKPVIRINRDILITALLVIAGIVLALALFGAGVLWRSKPLPTKFTFWVLTQLPRLDMVQTVCVPLGLTRSGAINTERAVRAVDEPMLEPFCSHQQRWYWYRREKHSYLRGDLRELASRHSPAASLVNDRVAGRDCSRPAL